jgi:hypothetical protein
MRENTLDSQDRGLTDSDYVALLNRGYQCPSDAGPMWRAAWEAGVDMSLLEDAIQMSPMQRLRFHQLALNQIIALMGIGLSHNDSRS